MAIDDILGFLKLLQTIDPVKLQAICAVIAKYNAIAASADTPEGLQARIDVAAEMIDALAKASTATWDDALAADLLQIEQNGGGDMLVKLIMLLRNNARATMESQEGVSIERTARDIEAHLHVRTTKCCCCAKPSISWSRIIEIAKQIIALITTLG